MACIDLEHRRIATGLQILGYGVVVLHH
jgi:hypothetical protein